VEGRFYYSRDKPVRQNTLIYFSLCGQLFPTQEHGEEKGRKPVKQTFRLQGEKYS